MDKNLHNIEDLFRKMLDDNEEIPSQKAWDGIEKKLDKDNVVSIKKKYNFLKKITVLLVLLLAGLCIYVWKFQDRNPANHGKDISAVNKETQTKNDSLSGEPGNSILQKQDDTLYFNKSNNNRQFTKSENKIIDKNILENNKVGLKKSLTSKNASNTVVKKNKIKFDKQGESQLSAVSVPPVLYPYASKSSIQKKDKLIERNSKEVGETKISDQFEANQHTANKPSGKQLNNNLITIQNFNPKSSEGIKDNSVGIFFTKESLQNNSLSKINPFIEIEKTAVTKPILKSMTHSRFSLSAFYSPDITFYHYQNTEPGNSNNTDFGKSETESYSSTLGALVEYSINKNWGLQSGLSLATSNFNLESQTLYAQPDNSGAIKYKLSTLLGDAYVKPSFSNNPNIGDSIFSKSTNHTLQYVGIPLIVKYNFNVKKFSLDAFAGISANLLTRGRIITELEYGNNNELETTDKIEGLKPFYLNGLTGVGLDYKIYKNLSIRFSPVLRFALNPINKNVAVQSYPNSVGFVFALKIKL
jgi:hypothetical protein